MQCLLILKCDCRWVSVSSWAPVGYFHVSLMFASSAPFSEANLYLSFGAVD